MLFRSQEKGVQIQLNTLVKDLDISITENEKIVENIITEQLTLNSMSRVAKFLYENGENYQGVKRYKIATILNITPETLSRIFKKLKELGLVCDNGKSFYILDKEGLKGLYT